MGLHHLALSTQFLALMGIVSTLAPGCQAGNSQKGYKCADGFPSASLLTQHSLESEHVSAPSLKGSQDRETRPGASSAEEHAIDPSTLGPCLAWLHLGPRKQLQMFLDFFSGVTLEPGSAQQERGQVR